MKQFSYTLLFSMALAVLSSCSGVLGVHGEGAAVVEQRSPGVFQKLALDIDADVILHSDSVYRLEITGQRNILDVLTTRVNNNELEIDFSDCVSEYSGITIHVYAPVYVAVSISGSGSIRNNDSLTAASLRIDINGSGTASLQNIRSNSVVSDISGSGNVTLSGSAQLFTHSVSGSGNLKAYDLITQTANLTCSGSGNCEVTVSQTLAVDISGSGDVFYQGNPALNVSISGSGRVVHVN
ncbi:MAG: DUF2807 domain-containing protein [Bacteroidetes bacterium]|nr:DUF2807 domain-containing protein [Bacteroidota bacterium]